ncbi:hypothetical protein GIB67_043203 [Kingdonia uniflora]|uniref:Pentatricopeptide repeat-containing protein n=1 Tax=Kingdonia uniflora TaxID=39325 RepID=A0A7J7NK60_9MAGN|nr:hypothetical protein GIB67_043203 [Kingdonia uniflora]
MSLRTNNNNNKLFQSCLSMKHQQRVSKNIAFVPLVRMLGKKNMPHVAYPLFLDMKCEVSVSTLSALMLCYADSGLFFQAQAIWDELINSSFILDIDIHIVSDLMNAYGTMGRFDEVSRVLRQVTIRDFGFCPKVYALAISCFGKGGKLQMMETTMKEMVSRGFPVDSATGNAFLRYYSNFGSIMEMEVAYSRLKRCRFLIEEEGIRAMANKYIRERRFYKLGEFVRDVGLARRNVGNLLWNMLLLSYAGNFKMKSLQREFLLMLEAGFSPDITTFNIRAIAFSRMSLFWDLYISLEHMNRDNVVPDLVTLGCVIDAFLDRKLGRNLDFALNKMNLRGQPVVITDTLVFEVLGKGDFHCSTEALLEFNRTKKWSYRELTAVYLRKKYRSNQIFWNY